MPSIQYSIHDNRLVINVSIALKYTTLHTENELVQTIIDTGFTGWAILPKELKQSAKDLLLLKMPTDQCPRYRRFKELDNEIAPSSDTNRG